MRNMLWATSVAALITITGTPMLSHAETTPGNTKPAAREKVTKEKAPKSALTGEYAAMVKDLNLSAEQTAKLESIALEHKKVASEWSKNNKAALAQAATEAKSDDEATKKAGREKSASLRKEMLDSKKSYTDQAMAVLTSEQRSTWEASKLANLAERSLKRHKIILTEEQSMKVKNLAAESLKGVDTSDTKALQAANMDLQTKIKNAVLTSEQSSQMPAAKTNAPKAGSKSKEAPKAKEAPKVKKPAAEKADDAGDEGDDQM